MNVDVFLSPADRGLEPAIRRAVEAYGPLLLSRFHTGAEAAAPWLAVQLAGRPGASAGYGAGYSYADGCRAEPATGIAVFDRLALLHRPNGPLVELSPGLLELDFSREALLRAAFHRCLDDRTGELAGCLVAAARCGASWMGHPELAARWLETTPAAIRRAEARLRAMRRSSLENAPG